MQNRCLMVTPIPPDARRFRMAVIPSTIFIFVAGFILGHVGGISLLLIEHGTHVNWAAVSKIVLLSIPAMLLFAFVWALVLRLLFPSYVSSAGVHGHSFWGTRAYLGWPDMARAKKFRLGNLVYLRLYSKTGETIIWFPLFLSPPAGFVTEIRKSAPPNHPILSHLA